MLHRKYRVNRIDEVLPLQKQSEGLHQEKFPTDGNKDPEIRKQQRNGAADP